MEFIFPKPCNGKGGEDEKDKNDDDYSTVGLSTAVQELSLVGRIQASHNWQFEKGQLLRAENGNDWTELICRTFFFIRCCLLTRQTVPRNLKHLLNVLKRRSLNCVENANVVEYLTKLYNVIILRKKSLVLGLRENDVKLMNHYFLKSNLEHIDSSSSSLYACIYGDLINFSEFTITRLTSIQGDQRPFSMPLINNDGNAQMENEIEARVNKEVPVESSPTSSSSDNNNNNDDDSSDEQDNLLQTSLWNRLAVTLGQLFNCKYYLR